ncbi:hypothetical protein J6590_051949 [Homalodisca vitripennis]|nr:hypothetical protein J6590_051949 [Homalodisca vitripennis]
MKAAVPEPNTGSSTATPTQELVVDALSTKDEELVVDKGSNFTLTCRSIYPVNWTYPHYITVDNEERSIPEIYLGVEDGLYIAKLTMYHAYFMDTGYFTCHQQNADFLVAQVYVYVRDEDNFLAMNNTMIFNTKQQGDTVEIPCRPTDPSLTIELFKDSEIYLIGKAFYSLHEALVIPMS